MQHKSSKRIRRQLLFSPHPQEDWPHPFPQNTFRRRMIQMIEHPQLPVLKREFVPDPHPELQPLSHPQFVAVKSLMRNPPCFSIQFTVCRESFFATIKIQIHRINQVHHIPIHGLDKCKNVFFLLPGSDNFWQSGWSKKECHCRCVPYSS